MFRNVVAAPYLRTRFVSRKSAHYLTTTFMWFSKLLVMELSLIEAIFVGRQGRL